MREQYLPFSFYIYEVFQYVIIITVIVIVIVLIMTSSTAGLCYARSYTNSYGEKGPHHKE